MFLADKIKRVGFLKTADDIFGNRFSYLRYLLCRFSNKVYFGSYLAATQGSPIRHYFMQEIVRHYCKNYKLPLNILEVGSWAGGSAITWAEAIKLHSGGGKVLCIDSWVDYIDSDKLWTHKTMKKAFRNDRIYRLFTHNIFASKHSDIVSAIRGASDEIFLLLKENQFDLIFIDGNHSYEFISNDIKNYAPLVKNGGLLCGDDMKLQYSEVDPSITYEMRNHDVIANPVTKKRYHPGVTLAVYNYFGEDVSAWKGFWAMQKDGGKWNKISLNVDEKKANIPSHLR